MLFHVALALFGIAGAGSNTPPHADDNDSLPATDQQLLRVNALKSSEWAAVSAEAEVTFRSVLHQTRRTALRGCNLPMTRQRESARFGTFVDPSFPDAR